LCNFCQLSTSFTENIVICVNHFRPITDIQLCGFLRAGPNSLLNQSNIAIVIQLDGAIQGGDSEAVS
ncbi:MAG: hypothetical protein ABW185_27920, partial [Sedimenticola sp.]